MAPEQGWGSFDVDIGVVKGGFLCTIISHRGLWDPEVSWKKMKINGAGHGLGDLLTIILPKGHQEVGYVLMQAYPKGNFVGAVKATKTFLPVQLFPVQLFRLRPVPALFQQQALCERKGAVGRGHETREKGRGRLPGKWVSGATTAAFHSIRELPFSPFSYAVLAS